MTVDGPAPPPEGKLLRTSRERAIPKLSIRAAAARIGISPEHWGNVERGYKSVSAGGPPLQVEASAELLAKMATAIEIDPDLMEAEGKRPDAAEIMRRTPAARPVLAPAPPPDPSQPTPAVVAFARDCHVDPGNAADPYLRSVRQEIADATLTYGAAATGRQIFRNQPWSLDEATVWDDAAIIRPDKELLIACTRALRDRNEAARQNRSGRAGLTLLARR